MSAGSSDRVRLEIADGVAEVWLNRPAKRNALDLAMFEAIAGTIDRLASIADLRAVLLTGEGPAFCAGIDLMAVDQIAAVDLLSRTHGPANIFQYCAWGWRALAVPVIAVISGQAFGGGLQIALGADIRLAAPDARLSVMESRWGLIPDMAGTVLLPHLVRDDLIRDLTYGARIVGAEEATAIGLCTRVCADALADGRALARAIAGQSPEAVRAAKRLLAISPDELERRLLAESVEQQALLRSAWHLALLSRREG